MDSRFHPIHCIQITPSSPASSYHSVVSTSSSRLIVPISNSSKPRPPRPALQFDTDRRPRVQFRGLATSPLSTFVPIDDNNTSHRAHTSGSSIPNTPDDEANYIRKSKLGLGLGIPEAPFNPDPSPIRSPGSEKLAKAEKGEFVGRPSPNFAQRIEEKLLEYSQSGNVVKRWLLEIISWTISALSMAAIIIILFIYSGKPVPTDWPMKLTLNAYISIFSAVASASLLLPASEALGQLKWSWFQGNSKKLWDFEIFDNASRGPWGSFLLLLRTKGTTLAALGAAITIFAMALDPFFQKVVHFHESLQPQIQKGSIPKITRYEPAFNQEFRIGEFLSNPNKDIQQVADKYFTDYGVPEVRFGNNTRPEIPISCPTSKCTWDPYDTLGVCGECVDVADMLEFGCHQAPLDWTQNANSFKQYENGTMCGWFFNATGTRPTLMSGYQIDPATNQSGEVLTTRSLSLVTNVNRRPLFGGSINFKHIRNPLTDFVVVAPADGPEDDKILNSIFRHEKPRAHECILSMCVKRIESSYESAQYTEVVTHRFVNNTPGPYPWTQQKVSEPGTSNPVQYFYFQNITINPGALYSQDNSSGYGMSNNTAFDIITVFDDYLPSFGFRKTNTSATLMKYKTNAEAPTFREYKNNAWLAPNNVSNHIERLATSLTNMIRFASNESVMGDSFGRETLVQVRWPWLSLPLGLLLFTLIFLTATIVRTSVEKEGVGIWKNSAVANIIHGLPDKYRQKFVASQADGTPRTMAKTLSIRMLPTQDWRISGLSCSPPLPSFESEEETSGSPESFV